MKPGDRVVIARPSDSPYLGVTGTVHRTYPGSAAVTADLDLPGWCRCCGQTTATRRHSFAPWVFDLEVEQGRLL